MTISVKVNEASRCRRRHAAAMGATSVLGLTGTKFGCGLALCDACTVHVDGVLQRFCVIPVGSVGDRAVTPIEAVSATPEGKALQQE